MKVEDFLNSVDYEIPEDYIPSDFALSFVNFIKLVNGDEGEENKTPIVHYYMLDTVIKSNRIANMCHRGVAKTTLLGEYLILYLAVYGEMPIVGKVDLGLYVSDSIENGVKNMRKNLEYRWENSEFLQQYVPTIKLTDIRWEFRNIDGKRLVMKGYGAKALSLDTSVVMLDNSRKTIADVEVGDYVMSPTGYQVKVTGKSEIFHRPMYRITLEDGRSIKVCEEHLNAVTVKRNPNNKATYHDEVLSTKELLEYDLQHVRVRKRKGKPDYISRENLLFIKNTRPVNSFNNPESVKALNSPVDPYTLGLLLGDGSMKKDGSVVLHCHKDDFQNYVLSLPDSIGEPYIDKRNKTVVSVSIKGVSTYIRELGLAGVHGNHKFIPDGYLYACKDARLALLQGLMDTDGSIQTNGRMDFCSNSLLLVEGVMSLVRSLGGTAKKRKVGKAYRTEIWIDICPFRLPRKVERFTGKRVKSLVAIKSITRIQDQPSQCISVESPYTKDFYDDEDHQFLIGDYLRTHNTGVRGAKEMGKRPQLALMDDLISDEDARSATVIASIEDTVYKAVEHALHPTSNMMIWSGTPFNQNDPLYKAVESGTWSVNVFPVCEQFPCKKSEFKGSWPDRFPYEYVKKKYDDALKRGRIQDFNQELMLRIVSQDDRIILDDDVKWYSRKDFLANPTYFNWYITTDFATSTRQSGDYSGVAIWAYNSNRDWFLVDGYLERVRMDTNIDRLFRFVSQYNPQLVGVEVNGQQGGFIDWIQREMLAKNIWFTLASQGNNNQPGLRAVADKFTRFNTVAPWFKTGKIHFPQEAKETPFIQEMLNELYLVTNSGIKSKHDDGIDLISQLSLLKVWEPSGESNSYEHTESQNYGSSIWDDEPISEDIGYNSYIV